MAENRYLKAMGFGTPADRVSTMPDKLLDGRGFLAWGSSKVPAAAGAFLAVKIKEWTFGKKKVQEYITKWGADVVGAVVVTIAAYALQFYATKYKPDSARLFDRITDGMVGHMGLSIIEAFKILLNKTGLTHFKIDEAKKPAGQGGKPANGLDGDTASIIDVSGLLANSPELLAEMGDRMYEVMRADGVNIDVAGKQAIVRSMHQVTSAIANGAH